MFELRGDLFSRWMPRLTVPSLTPSATGKHLAEIVLHKSGGLSSHETGYAKQVSHQGYVVAVIDNFVHPETINNDDFVYTHCATTPPWATTALDR